MVGSIYFVQMPYSDFKEFKGRPVLVFRHIDKSDVLVLPLTSNLKRDGIVISNKDIKSILNSSSLESATDSSTLDTIYQ